jgi:MoxR-like ATPase
METESVPLWATAVRDRLLGNVMAAREVCLERDELLLASTAAFLAREHVWLYGPPGTGKSELVRYFASQFSDARYGEFLFSKQTTESDVIAYRDVPAYLAGRDQWNLTPLTGAEIAFADELFKSSSATLNGALAWLNERRVKGCLDSPLQTLFAASNEIPRGEELSALRDRLLVAFDVKPIQTTENRKRMLCRGPLPALQPVSMEDIGVARAAIGKLTMSDAALDALIMVHGQLNAAGIPVTDRRLVKSIGYIKAHAWLTGETLDVQPSELQCLRHVLWLLPDQQPAVEAALSMIDRGVAGKMQDLVDEVGALYSAALQSNELFLRAATIINAATAAAPQIKAHLIESPLLKPRAARYMAELKGMVAASKAALQSKIGDTQ